MNNMQPKPGETFKDYLARVKREEQARSAEKVEKPAGETKEDYLKRLKKENWSNSSEREI